MTGGMKIDWHGTEQLTMMIAGAGPKVRQDSSRVVKNHTEILLKKTKDKAPKDTEFLKDNIKSSHPNDLEGRVGGEAAYDGYQEFGTRFQTGTPHYRPALKEVEPGFKQDMTDVMKGAFK